MFDCFCPIRRQAQSNPHKTALITDSEKISYKKLDEKIEEIKDLLIFQGVRAHHLVAFIAPAIAEAIYVLFALHRIQATSFPLSPRFPPSMVEKILDYTDCNFTIDIKTYTVKKIHSKEQNSYLKSTPIFTLLSSSGSTSTPKIIAHSMENFLFSAHGSNIVLDLNNSHSWLLSIPLYHVGGLCIIFRCFLVGACVIISSSSIEESLKKNVLSHISLVPTQLYRLLENDLFIALKKLQCILVGGAIFPKGLYEKAVHLGLNIHSTYGMTETASQITMDLPKLANDEHTSGLVLPFREIKISSESEILVRGNTLFKGYLTQDKQLHLPVIDGWFATNDIGFLNDANKLIVTGRKDLMFISGGENIHPENIEKELLELPGIDEAVVLPIEDMEFGNRPVAFVRQNKMYTLEMIKNLLKKRLPGFAIPVALYELPERSDQLKVSRSDLKKLIKPKI